MGTGWAHPVLIQYPSSTHPVPLKNPSSTHPVPIQYRQGLDEDWIHEISAAPAGLDRDWMIIQSPSSRVGVQRTTTPALIQFHHHTSSPHTITTTYTITITTSTTTSTTTSYITSSTTSNFSLRSGLHSAQSHSTT